MSETSELVYEFKLDELLVIEEGELTALRRGEFFHLTSEELISLGGTLMQFLVVANSDSIRFDVPSPQAGQTRAHVFARYGINFGAVSFEGSLSGGHKLLAFVLRDEDAKALRNRGFNITSNNTIYLETTVSDIVFLLQATCTASGIDFLQHRNFH